MSNIIRLPGDAHQATQLLLPWYATGRLDEADRARVAAHLETCAVCRADLKLERRLEAEVGALPLDVERGWAAMSRRLEQAERSKRATAAAHPAFRRAAPWIGGAAAACLVGAAIFAAVAPRPPAPTRYHALASPAAAIPGNLIVVFRPDATEAQISAAVTAADARIADGPTAAGAYLLRVPPASRDQALRRLRAARAIEMAEPIEEAAP